MTEAKTLIEQTKTFVKKTLADAEKGHDWFHTQRVYHQARTIARGEQADLLVVELAALLHDIADPKFHNGDESIGPAKAENFLRELNVEEKIVQHVCNIIRHMSYKNSLAKGQTQFHSKEMAIVQDADRLDAIGAIGIARTFHYGGYKNRLMFDPGIPPLTDLTKEAYKSSTAPTINHFYEKLLRLKDMMHTETAKQLARERHDFMLAFLEQFYKEWGEEDK